MTSDDIDRIVTKADFVAKFDDETPFLVVLVLPSDDERMGCNATIITHTVLRLLWKIHHEELRRKSIELFHIFSGHSKTTVAAGWLFEAIVHDMLEKGINVPIDRMSLIPNYCCDAVNDKHVNSNVGQTIWQSSAMKFVPFTKNDRTLVVEPLRYYVPTDPTQPTFDSFTFELVSCASYEGPILNPKSKEICDRDNVSFGISCGMMYIHP